MLKFLLLCGYEGVGCTCHNLNYRRIEVGLFCVFKVVFHRVKGVGVFRPLCGIACVPLYLKGKFSITAHRKVSFKPTEEYISGLVGCDKCNLLAVGVGSAAFDRAASVIVYKRVYTVGVS